MFNNDCFNIILKEVITLELNWKDILQVFHWIKQKNVDEVREDSTNCDNN